jgi:hypothetical protein
MKSLSPEMRELMDAGLISVLEAAAEMVGQTRLIFGTNDVVIVAVMDKDGARMYGNRRERIIKIVEDTLPEASNTLARLREGPVPVDKFLVLFSHNASLYTIAWNIPEKTTLGVLN